MSVAAEELSGLIREVHYTCRRCLDARLGQFATSVAQWYAMRTISRNPGWSQSELARLTRSSNQAFSTLMRRLAARGFIESRTGLGRAEIPELTPTGRVMLREADEIVHRVIDGAFAPLADSERQALRAMLWRVLEAEQRLRREPGATRALPLRVSEHRQG